MSYGPTFLEGEINPLSWIQEEAVKRLRAYREDGATGLLGIAIKTERSWIAQRRDIGGVPSDAAFFIVAEQANPEAPISYRVLYGPPLEGDI